MIKVTSADALARLLDEQQDEPHDACLQAMRTGTAVLTDDLPEGDPPARVIAHGIRSVPSTPLLIGSRPDRAGEPVRRGGVRVRRGINHRGNATHRAGRGHRDRGVAALPQEAAVDGLRTGSQNRNIPLRQVAADLVDKTIDPSNAPSA